MRVDDWIKRSVVFLGINGPSGFIPVGTAFIMGVRAGAGQHNFLITAGHVVNSITGESVYVRLNDYHGGTKIVSIDKRNMIQDIDPSFDLAILVLNCSSVDYDFTVYMANRSERQAILTNFEGIGLGDEVFAVGLYTSQYGEKRNLPILRMGNVAAIPDEPIRTPTGFANGYLVELVSIGGLSGSPVCFNAPPIWFADGKLAQGRNFVPVGILLGHHEMWTREDQIRVSQYQSEKNADHQAADFSSRSTNICSVIPIERVYDVFEREDVAAALGASPS